MEEKSEIEKTEFKNTEPETIGRLLVTGDLHGDAAALTMIGKLMEPHDMLFVAGDFGFVFVNDKKEGNFLNDLNLFLRKNNESYIVFVDGNHENHTALAAFPVEEWNGARVHKIRSHIIHVLRGEVITLKNHNIFCFGGAYSIDRKYRVLNESYWKEEVPNDKEMENGNKNLKRHNNKIDYVISHTCPLNLVPALLGRGGFHAVPEERPLQNYLQFVSEEVSDSLIKYYFGHWHQDRCIGDKYRAIYLDLLDLQTGEKIW